MSSKKEQADNELRKLNVIAKNIGHTVHSVLLDCPKIQEVLKEMKPDLANDEVLNENCRKCKDEATCVNCRCEHKLKNYIWRRIRSIFSQSF